jgi:hypothetical protein
MATIFGTLKKAWDNTNKKNYVQVVGKIDVDTTNGGGLYVNGSALASTELGFIDGVTAGTATASKALVLGSAKQIATITTATITNANIGTLTGSTAFVFGTSGAPVVNDTAGTKFLSIYTDCGATSDDARGIYNRLYITGAGGGGESLRSYTDVSVAAATAHGCHISLGFGESTTSGAVTGLGVAGRFTLGLANVAYPGTGTLAVLQAEVYSFGANSDSASNAIAMLNLGNHGNATGAADVDDDAVAISFTGWTAADGNMIATKAAGTCPNVTKSIRIKIGDTLHYLYAGDAPLTA